MFFLDGEVENLEHNKAKIYALLGVWPCNIDEELQREDCQLDIELDFHFQGNKSNVDKHELAVELIDFPCCLFSYRQTGELLHIDN